MFNPHSVRPVPPDAMPLRYVPGLDAQVEAAAARCGIPVFDENGHPVLWWHLVDALFAAGETKAAAAAQRRAVPPLSAAN